MMEWLWKTIKEEHKAINGMKLIENNDTLLSMKLREDLQLNKVLNFSYKDVFNDSSPTKFGKVVRVKGRFKNSATYDSDSYIDFIVTKDNQFAIVLREYRQTWKGSVSFTGIAKNKKDEYVKFKILNKKSMRNFLKFAIKSDEIKIRFEGGYRIVHDFKIDCSLIKELVKGILD